MRVCCTNRTVRVGTALAFARRLASFQIALAKDLDLPEPKEAIEIDRCLIDFPTNCTAGNVQPPPPCTTTPQPCAHAGMADESAGSVGRRSRVANSSAAKNCSWVSFGNATVEASDDFSLCGLPDSART